MNSRWDFLPPLSLGTLLVAVGVTALVWLVLRLAWGGPEAIARRRGLVALRVLIVALVGLLLVNPVRMDESPGQVRRPDVFYLLDASQSMAIGKTTSRWEDALERIAAARAKLADPTLESSIKTFRFGHRLTAIEAGPGQPAGALEPTDTDTRLAEALQQLTSRFGRKPPAAVVLFSDGRVRDADGVEELARHYGAQGVPIHVVPGGDTASGGDLALVNVVAPRGVHKFSTVEIQVFLRSFGYDGQRVEVQALEEAAADGPPTLLDSAPLTLASGVQSVTLTYRSGLRDQDVRIVLPPLSDELSTRNNALRTDIQVLRTKIRVLYLEGSDDPIRSVRRGERIEWVGPHSTLQEALVQDEDIECVPLVVMPGAGQLLRVPTDANVSVRRGFPDTQAELAAFDAVILSNVARSLLTDEQVAWLEHWVSNRGGGLLMVGGPGSFAAGGWDEGTIARMLPVTCADNNWSPTAEVALVPPADARQHAVWSIVADRKENDRLLLAVPPLVGFHRGLVPKPLSSVLATCGEPQGGSPALVAGVYGRGRTLALAAPITLPAADRFLHNWGPSGNQYAAKFWRNVVYWLTENSSVGRRRLVATVDKQYYRPGETIALRATAFDETAAQTTGYRVWGMLEPMELDLGDESLYSSLRWPNGLPRESGEEGPYVAWGEEFELVRDPVGGDYQVPLEIAERLRAGTDNQGLRIELTAYEGGGTDEGLSRGTQVDSMSLDVQVLDDPFEQQNPFPNHDLLRRVAELSGGSVIESPAQLAGIVSGLPAEAGPADVRRVPMWDRWWLLALVGGLLAVEWFWRRAVGLA